MRCSKDTERLVKEANENNKDRFAQFAKKKAAALKARQEREAAERREKARLAKKRQDAIEAGNCDMELSLDWKNYGFGVQAYSITASW